MAQDDEKRILPDDLVRRIKASVPQTGDWPLGKDIHEAVDMRSTWTATYLFRASEANGSLLPAREVVEAVEKGGEALESLLAQARRAILWHDLADEVMHCKVDR